MANEDMSQMIDKLNSMLNGNKVPDNIQELLNNLKQNNNSGNDSNDVSSSSSNNINPEMINTLAGVLNNTTNSNASNNIDIEMIMKMKTIIDQMNNTKDDPRANLLLSLKPYLKNSRKEKLDQYIKFLNMSKVMEAFNSNNGGSNK